MTNPDPSSGLRQRSSIPRALVSLLVLALVAAAAAYGGFAYGVAQVEPAPTPEVVVVVEPTLPPQVQEVEVTREVTMIITATPAPTAVEMVRPGDAPPAAETPQASGTGGNTQGAQSTIDSGTFDEVWGIIEQEFDGELPQAADRIYGAITGSLGALDDPYTRFLRPEIAERMRDVLDGSVSGIGAFVRETDEGHVEIVRPMDGQPADLAGILPGDVIIAIDGDSVLDLSFDEVLLMVRGPEGSVVTLTIAREGEAEPLDVEVVRAVFEVPVVESEMLGGEDGRQVAYVRLSSFTQAAEQSVLDALTNLLAENPDGIILDLRDNGGGFLDQAVGVADIFLPAGIVLRERSDSGLNETFRADDGDIGEALPLAVLVNAGSASASEIVAGAVQDSGRGALVGETTFGKGSVQHVHTLPDGSELRVTIARWYTPNDRSINDNGISPDIEVETPQDLGGEDDPQLQAALDYVLNGE